MITGLKSEETRWTEDKINLGISKACLVGDCLLNCAFLSYLGAFNYDFRVNLLNDEWHANIVKQKIPLSENWKLTELLTSDVEIAKWASEGLPQDELSVQNGILTTKANRYPLCIDPQMQAVAWIKHKEEMNEKTQIKTFNDDFMKFLILCIKTGKAFLFENIDVDLDPSIEAVLEKNYEIVAGQKFLKFGDEEIEVDDNFKL